MEILSAIIFGSIFGFALNRVGATNPNYTINMVRLRDTHLMKVILFAIGLSSALLFLGIAGEIIPVAHLSIKSSYIGVIIGGAILGAGFAIAGYCPGTGLVSAATGRKDAMVFIIGGLAGALAYIYSYQYLKETFLMDKIAGGNAMLADLNIDKYSGLIHSISGTSLAIIIGIILMAVAYKLPKKIL